MNSGILGVNIRQGVNNDQAAAFHREVRPWASLVHDEAKLIPMIQTAGSRVVWRVTGDDPQHNPLRISPALFVQLRFNAAGGDKTVIYHLTNELGQSTAHDTWTLAALRECRRLGVTACLFNHYTHTGYSEWMRSESVLREAVQAGDYIGAHVYWSGAFPASADDPAHAFLRVRDRLGGKWIITELGWAARRADGQLDPNQGWQGRISEQEYADQLGRAAGFYAQHGVPALIFSWGVWP